MLLRFGVENHRSVRDYQEVSFVSSSLKGQESALMALPAGEGEGSRESGVARGIKVLPVIALYGANASGKSTVLEAFKFFRDGIISSHAHSSNHETTAYLPFLLDKESRSRPSRYDADIVLGETRYHYGYTLDGKRILAEWLYSFPTVGARQVKSVLFHRDASSDQEYYFGKSLKGENKQISRLTRDNSLFLSSAALNAHPQLSPIYEFFKTKITRRFDSEVDKASLTRQLVAYFESNESSRSAALKFLSEADTGIIGMDFSRVPIRTSEKAKEFISEFEVLITKHLGSDLNLDSLKGKESPKVGIFHAAGGTDSHLMDLDVESSGTKSLLNLLGPIYQRLADGGVIIIDELNSTLHPLISRKIVSLFMDPETNSGKAQLIFSTHDTNILSSKMLRRDQIIFAEKDEFGSTHVYALSDIKARADENIEAGYLRGKFGAIPFLGVGSSFFAEADA